MDSSRRDTTLSIIAGILAVAVVGAVAYRLVGGDPGATPVESRILTEGPQSDEEATKHLIRPPELPEALAGSVITTSELRHPQLFDRHIIELVDVAAGAAVSLAEPLIAGALIRVPEGASVEVGAAADVAAMSGDTVVEVRGSCPAPCAVVGPALIAADGWMVGFGVQPDWMLVVPAP